MLSKLIKLCTPRVAPPTQLFIAAGVWTTMGLVLMTRALGLLYPTTWIIACTIMLVGLILGMLKAKMILDPVADRIIARIQLKNQPSCLGGLFSLRNWAIILTMIILGKILKHLALPTTIQGTLYSLVGIALLYSSRLMWIAWHQLPRSSR